mmetsp:Transcript_69826/g.227162  ORF Transcript_69826/g.227162 Transcript_69826/m.227162 type:complete len:144 (-) Transcript_69826:458-889(-)
MTLSPFVFEQDDDIKSFAGISCFDESSPCVLEQYSACVMKVTNDQAKYVPWLVCMDTDGETPANVEVCAKKFDIDYSKVSSCQKTQGMDLLRALLKHDANVHETPTTLVDGKKVEASFAAVKKTLCSAHPTLKACGSEDVLMV